MMTHELHPPRNSGHEHSPPNAVLRRTARDGPAGESQSGKSVSGVAPSTYERHRRRGIAWFVLVLSTTSPIVATYNRAQDGYHGYTCNVGGKEVFLTWRNTTHYGARAYAFNIEELTGCRENSGVVDIYAQVCIKMYEEGWTCVGGRFNRDLTVFRSYDVDDCELKEILLDLEMNGYENTAEWDTICRDSGITNERPRLTGLAVAKYPPIGASYRVMNCTDPKTGERQYVDWANATHKGVGPVVSALETTCSPLEVVFEAAGGTCDGSDDLPWFCTDGRFDSRKFENSTVRPTNCLLLEVAQVLREDREDAVKWLDTVCSNNLGGRRLDYQECCGLGNGLGRRKSRKTRLGFAKSQVSANFHFHFRNLQDLRWVDKLPPEWGASGSYYDESWPFRSYWYRSFFQNYVSLYKETAMKPIHCEFQSYPFVHVFGSVRGSIRFEGQLRNIEPGSSCVVLEKDGYVYMDAPTLRPCYVNIESFDFTQYLSENCFYTRNGCNGF